MGNMKKLLSMVLAVVMAASLCSFPAFAADSTSWSLNDQIASLAVGTSLPANGTVGTGIFTGLTQSNKDNQVIVSENSGVKVVRAQLGWGGNNTEIILDLPQTYSSGTLVARFDMLLESTVANYDWENGKIEWVEAGFANSSDYVTRALVGGSDVNKLDWDGDLLGASQAHADDTWYTYELTVDLDNNVRAMTVYDASGSELGHTDGLTIDANASVSKFRFASTMSGDFCDSAYLVRNLVVAVDSLPSGGTTSTPTVTPASSLPSVSVPTSSTPIDSNAYYISASDLTAGNWWDQGGTVTLPQARANAQVIQNALDTVGKNGGGTVVLPEGTYCIAGDYTKYSQYCLYINYNNTTLLGAGKSGDSYKTVLKANSHWNGNGQNWDSRSGTASGTVYYRNSGIKIVGTSWGSPRQNVRLEGFELDGSRGWSGDYSWGYDPSQNYGWDVNHKGITVSQDDQVTHVFLNDLDVHSFSGETLYVGGQMVGYLEVINCKLRDTNASCFNLYASYLNVQGTQFGDPNGNCRFWIEYSPRPSTVSFTIPAIPSYFTYPINTAYFSGNSFYNSVGAHGIAITQGNSKSYTTIFENNFFDNSRNPQNYSTFQIAGAVYGPTYIERNTFTNTKGPVIGFSFGGSGTVDENGNSNTNWQKNKNIYLRDNVGTNLSGVIVDMWQIWNSQGDQPIENFIVSGNHFTANTSNATTVAAGWDANLNNVQIFNNTFVNGKEPTEATDFDGNAPLFYNNTYTNTTAPVQSASSQLKPFYEKMMVKADYAVTATMRTGKNEDGQRVDITATSDSAAITFAANDTSKGYKLDQAYVLRAGNTLTLEYDTSTQLWSLPSGDAPVVSTPVSSTPVVSTPVTSTPVTSTPTVVASEYWKLNDQIAGVAGGTALPAYDAATTGLYTGLTQSNKDNSVTVIEDGNGKYVRAQNGWGGGSTELILNLPQTYTTGKLVAKFDMLIESTVVNYDWENGKIEWVDAGFANNNEFVTRALVGGSDVNKLDWDGDLLGTTQAHARDTWYTYMIEVDLDANTRTMVVYDANGNELGHTDGLTIDANAAVNMVRFAPTSSGDFTDSAYLVRDLEVGYTGDQASSTPTSSTPASSTPVSSTPVSSTPVSSTPVVSTPSVEASEYWKLNDQIVDVAGGTVLPAYDSATTGLFTGLTQSNKDNSLTVIEDGNGKYVRAQNGWGGGSTELILNLPQTYTTGKLVAKFDMLIESTVQSVDWENGKIEWVEAGFANNNEYVTRALVGGSDVNKLDWDGDLLGTSQAHADDTWYTYVIEVDLDANTRSMIVYDANGTELGHTDGLTIAADAAVNMVRFMPTASGDFTDSAYLVRNLEVGYTGDQASAPTAAAVSGSITSTGSGTVTVELIQNGNVAYTTTTTNGSYSIANVAAGSYTLKVSKSMHAAREYAVTVGSSNVTQNAEIWLVGDVNGDGVVNTRDALQINRSSAKKTSVFDTQDADADYRKIVGNVNGDSEANTRDALQINRYSAKKSSMFDSLA